MKKKLDLHVQNQMTVMQKTREALLVTWLLWMTCMPLGLSEPEESQSGTFSEDDYSGWLDTHKIKLVNYVAEVGTNVPFPSPMTPPPNGTRLFSHRLGGTEVGSLSSNNSNMFLTTSNTSWNSILTSDAQYQGLIIQNVQLGYADILRVLAEQDRSEETEEESSKQPFDVAITLMTYEEHKCSFKSRPVTLKMNDSLTLSCSVIVNGMWNASLIFRNEIDGSVVIGDLEPCGIQPSLGTKLCRSVTVNVDTQIFAYSCLLAFPSEGRHIPTNPEFQISKWTAEFNTEVACSLPKIYLDAIPYDVNLLCNHMPCGDTIEVGETITCIAHGYPQPVFAISIKDGSTETEIEAESDGSNPPSRLFMDAGDDSNGDNTKDTTEVEIKGFQDFQIGPSKLGHVEIICNVTNALGWGHNALPIEIKLGSSGTNGSGAPTFRLEDYTNWDKYRVNLVNYIAEVGSDIRMLSPMMPPPLGISWSSLNLDSELLPPSSNSTPFGKYQKINRTPFEILYDYDEGGREWLEIQKIPVGYADVFRVLLVSPGNKTSFDGVITLMTYEKHECGYVSKPESPALGSELELNCSAIVNGWWNASLVFRNNYDDSEVRGELYDCGGQPSTSKICATVKIKAEADILAYSCRLDFPSSARQYPRNPLFQNSKWTDEFAKNDVACHLPIVYLDAIPSDVNFLCNNMPCDETALVNDTITCLSHGYPQPNFDLRIVKSPLESATDATDEESDGGPLFLDTSDESSEVRINGSRNYRISKDDIGRVELTCNVSNALGWGESSLKLEVVSSSPVSPGAASGAFTLDDFPYWLKKNHTIDLKNYVVEAGKDVIIKSPITPVPAGVQWFSQNKDGRVTHDMKEESDRDTLNYLEKFRVKYGSLWHSVFRYDVSNESLEIRNANLDYADVFRVVARDETAEESDAEVFDVVITLMTYEKHECDFETKPQNPKMGDPLTLTCSAVVNGLWNASFAFVNEFDESKIIGETRLCDRQETTAGSNVCSTVNLQVNSDVLAYSCRLEFVPNNRQEPKISANQSSTFSTEFNRDVVCYLPRVYPDAIPSEINFLCNQMPCGETVSVNDIVSCTALGYPQPVIDIRIGKSPTAGGGSVDGPAFLDTSDESSEAGIQGFKDYKIKKKDRGQVLITCNASNELGWGENSLDIEVLGLVTEDERTTVKDPVKGRVVGPGEGPSEGPDGEGPTKGPGKGPTKGPGKGPSKGPGKGPTKGHGEGPTEGPDEGPTEGPDEGPTEGPDEGPDKVGKYECGFTPKPDNPKRDDSLTLSCSTIIDGISNASLIFRNELDGSEVTGETLECSSQSSADGTTKICSSVTVTVDADIIFYSCQLKNASSEEQDENKCFLPKVYIEAIPSEIAFVCNNMPCEHTASVGDIITCIAHVYPQPVFDIRIIQMVSTTTTPTDDDGTVDGPAFLDTSDISSEVEIKGYKEYKIRNKDRGQVEVTCNVSNALGYGYSSMELEILGSVTGEDVTDDNEDVTDDNEDVTDDAEDVTDERQSAVTLLPGSETLLPESETLSPGSETLLPESETRLPGSETLLPGSETLLSGSETLSPGSETLVPKSETLLPGSETLLPGSETLLPGSETPLPGSETLLPDSIATQAEYDILTTREDHELHKDFTSDSEFRSVEAQCNRMKCGDDQALAVGDEISCTGGGKILFHNFVLKVNNVTKQSGGGYLVQYNLQMEDVGEIRLECIANYSGFVVATSVNLIVLATKAEHEEAGGDIGVDQAEKIAKRPSGKEASGPSGEQKQEEEEEEEEEKEKQEELKGEMAADRREDTAAGITPAPGVANSLESFVLLQLFLAFVAGVVGLVQI